MTFYRDSNDIGYVCLVHSPVEVRVLCTECIAATRMTPLSKRKLSQSVEHTQDGPQGGGGRMESG